MVRAIRLQNDESKSSSHIPLHCQKIKKTRGLPGSCFLEVERSPRGERSARPAGPVGLARFCREKQRAQLNSLTQGKLLPCSPPKIQKASKSWPFIFLEVE